jgi:hypothetical protein
VTPARRDYALLAVIGAALAAIGAWLIRLAHRLTRR